LSRPSEDFEEGVAFGKVRGFRLLLARLYEDDEDGPAVLEEIGDCAMCLRGLIYFLTSLASSLSVAVAERAGRDRDAAVQQVEKQLDEALDELRQL
jgi:hypothetical protein